MPHVENIRMFVRVYELGSMSEAARDQRVSPAVASSRIAKLEKHLGVRLFNRTTRRIHTTEHGQAYYEGAIKILQAIEEAEAAVATIANYPRGSIYVAAPLGVGKRFIAPNVPAFKDEFPEINVRLRMSDRNVDITKEGIDVAFHLGTLRDSALRLQNIAECPRVLCASPDYVSQRGTPRNGEDLITDGHDCLLLRFPGDADQDWTLMTTDGPRKFNVTGPFESDDGDVLTDWALDGRGIANKPVFEIAEHLKSGALIPVATQSPPTPAALSCLYPHKRYQDPKIELFIDFMITRCREKLKESAAAYQLPR
ncbi:MAG: LysR family transcriptional regulator [Alphaproteobacteria bacterium]|jgi:DNA-binding transcriptional LysR family regulator|nr:LysR family transcriptional regulator [Alphaproteobacteria bacterium]